ncbi:Thoeris anti-defense Tad2 family protein [Eubacterium maltosivorans]|uniref:Thoeris anti-defense Tad2 family protein n=1 Tax=Eubacterium maltosivorans TaxID=2041044 RepID=UPI00189D2FFD|nr:MW1434 family type I TA system toxin [Eubacterium maltosivorans]
MFNQEKIRDLESRVKRLEDQPNLVPNKQCRLKIEDALIKDADFGVSIAVDAIAKRLKNIVQSEMTELKPKICEGVEELNYEKKGTFGWALQQLKKGKVVSRMKHIKKIPAYVFRLESKLSKNPVILMQFDNKEVFWIPDTEDLLAEDWLLIDKYDVSNGRKVAITMTIPDTSEKLLNFHEAFKLMRQEDLPVKRQCWNGYWKWDGETILIFTADNRIVNIRETRFLANTIKEILADDWEIATEENCSVPIV